jgi:hypothetical protein
MICGEYFMNAFDTYLTELESLLPGRLGVEIHAEVKAELEDELEDYLTRCPGMTADAAMAEIIARRQSPESVVASLRAPGRGFIGPLMYPIYQKVILVQWLLVLIAAIAAALGRDAFDAQTVMRSIWGGLTSSFLITTMTFAVLDRYGYARGLPADLVMRKKLNVRWSGEAAGRHRTTQVIIAIAILILADVHPAWVGLPYVHDGIHVIPLFRAEAVAKMLPVAHFFIGALFANYIIMRVRQRVWLGATSRALRGLMLVAALVMLVGTGGPSATAWVGVAGVNAVNEQVVETIASLGAMALAIVCWGGFVWAAYRWIVDMQKIRAVGV